MSKPNVFDMLCDAIEDYNNYVDHNNVSKLSYEEKRGLLYNCLRRKFMSLAASRRSSSSLNVSDIACSFDEKGRIVWINISKSFYPSYNWSGEQEDMNRLYTVQTIKQLVNEIPFWYPTKALNELSYIVNSIKIT